MKTVHPKREAMKEFMETEDNGEPIVMINLLKYKEIATYEGEGEKVSGKKAYVIYSKKVTKLLLAAGGQIVWMGKVSSSLIIPDGESWDAVLLVRYPNKTAFVEMTQSEAYKKIAHHRTAAIEDSRLMATTEINVPSMALRALSFMYRMKSWMKKE